MKKFVLLITFSVFLGVSGAFCLREIYETHIDRSTTIRYPVDKYRECYVDLKNGKYYHLFNCKFEPNINSKYVAAMSVYEAIERNFAPCPFCHKTQDVRIEN
jgi:hypothetical protein